MFSSNANLILADVRVVDVTNMVVEVKTLVGTLKWMLRVVGKETVLQLCRRRN